MKATNRRGSHGYLLTSDQRKNGYHFAQLKGGDTLLFNYTRQLSRGGQAREKKAFPFPSFDEGLDHRTTDSVLLPL